jgi:hypothetical protein
MTEPNPLRDLDLDTAIRLRWVLRDIYAGRAKLIVPRSDDLALLEQLGLITTDDGKLVLTTAADQILWP